MTTNTVRTGAEAFVASSRPNKNYPSPVTLRVQNNARESFIRPKSPAPAGAKIATTYLYLTQANAPGGTNTVRIQALTADLKPAEITWNDRPGASATIYPPVSKVAPPVGTVWKFDITAYLQGVVNGAPNRGIRLQATTPNEVLFYSSHAEQFRPYIEVDWSTPPAKPTKLTPSFANVSVAKWVQAVNFVDRSGADTLTHVQVQIDPTADWTGADFWDSGQWPVPAANTAEIDLAATSYPGLAFDAVTTLRARVTDSSGGVSPWSDPVTVGRKAKGTVTLLSPAAAVDMTNTVQNPSFETNTTLYTMGNLTLPQDATWAEQGSKSAIVNVTAASTSTSFWPQGPMTSPNNRHAGVVGDKVSVRFRVKPLRNQGVRINIVQYDASGASVGTLNGVTQQVVAGQEITLERLNTALTAPTVAAFGVQVFLYEPNTTTTAPAATGNAMHIDGVMVVNTGTADAPSPLTYFDGSTTADGPYTYSWFGTPHLTRSFRSVAAVTELTPPIVWSVSGMVQSQYRVIIRKASDPKKILKDTGPVKSATTAYTIPKGILNDSDSYIVTVMVWDDEVRETAGTDTAWVEASATFGVAYSATIATPSALVATQAPGLPAVDLTVNRATTPDSWTFLRREVGGKWEGIATDIPPQDIDVDATTWAYRDYTARLGVTYTYMAKAEVNGVLSAAGPTATITPAEIGIWILDPQVPADYVQLGGKDFNGDKQDNATTYTVMGSADVVRTISGLTGLTGDANLTYRTRGGRTWRDVERILNRMKSKPTATFRLLLGDLNIPVILGNVNPDMPHPDSRPDQVLKMVSFTFWQNGEHPFEVNY